jgi:hypothetical protein
VDLSEMAGWSPNLVDRVDMAAMMAEQIRWMDHASGRRAEDGYYFLAELVEMKVCHTSLNSWLLTFGMFSYVVGDGESLGA